MLWIGYIDGFIYIISKLDVHKFNKDPTNIMKPRHGKIVWDP
jgi:hypothetical protein